MKLAWNKMTPQERVEARIERLPDGCWKWHGAASKGRPVCMVGGKHRLVYLLIYEWNYGPRRDGLLLHHRCLRPWCINPEHLEPLSDMAHRRLHSRLTKNSPPDR